MRRALFFVLFLCSPFLFIFSQSNNDLCRDATPLDLKLPDYCPAISTVVDTFHSSNIAATPSSPPASLPACTGGGADVWFRFQPKSNNLNIRLIGELASSQLVLFEGDGCDEMFPIACASGTGQTELQADVDPLRSYFLLVGSGSADDQSGFDLIFTASNNCSPCILGRQGFFSSFPGPENGTFSSGQSVQMCYVVNRWDASSTGELLHALEVDFGNGWDQSSFVAIPPASCSPFGSWNFYDIWTSSANGQQFGPGFAFDGSNFGVQDGNPGNNRGMGGNGCSNIGISAPELAFCWTINVKECPGAQFGPVGDLSVNVRMLGDGISGSWIQSFCGQGKSDQMSASHYCPDPLAPEISAMDASCISNCDGAIYLGGGGSGPWAYTVFDSTGAIVYSNPATTSADTVSGLCAGIYDISIVDLASGGIRTSQVNISAGVVPEASASFLLPCIAGEPIQLYGEAVPAMGASYSWTGPNGFSSNFQDPLALYSGTYSLVVTVDGCASLPFILEIPPVEGAVANIVEDTIAACPGDSVTLSATGSATAFSWYDTSTGMLVGNGPSITIAPDGTTTYRVTGSDPNSGCNGFDDVVVSIPFQPFVESNANGILCPGTEVTISVSQGATFEWSTGDTTATIMDSPDASTIYYVTVTDGGSCSVTLSAFVQVSSTAGLFISPDVSICEGESVTLFAGGGAVEWSTGATTGTITVSPTQTTTYTATIRDLNGCFFDLSVTVTVNPAPDIQLAPADTTSICLGDTVALQVFLSDSLFWDTLVAPVQSTTYTIPGADSLGCLDIGSFTVAVLPLPSVSINGPSQVCGTDSIQLSAIGTGSFSWNTGDSTQSIYVNPVGAALYSVTATNGAGCQAADSLEVQQSDAPASPVISCTASLGSVVFSWPVDTSLVYTINTSGPAGAFLSAGSYAIEGLSPGQMVTIELKATNAAGCTSSTSASCSSADCSILGLTIDAPDAICADFGQLALFAAVANGSGNGQGSWSGPGVNDTAAIFDPAVSGPGTFALVYAYSDAGCTASDTLTITVEQPLEESMIACTPTASSVSFSWDALPQDTGYQVEVLTGQSGTFTGPTSFEVDSLQPGDTVAITITALGSSICGAITVSSSCVAVGCPALDVRNDTIICSGQSIVLETDSTEWDNFQWAPAAGLSCTDCPSPVASPSVTTVYTVIASTNTGCSDTAQVAIYVGEIPDSYLPDDPIFFCVGEPLEICMPEGDIYLWVGTNAFLSQEQCLQFDSATAANAGPYYAILRTGFCRITKRIELIPARSIVVTSITDFQSSCPDSTFTIAVEADNAVSYSWTPAEYLECPSCSETQGSVPQTATFTVEMADQYGCTATDMATVFIDDCAPRPVIGPGAGTQLSSEKFRFYPNPARSAIRIEMPAEGVKDIQLLNGSGRLVYQARSTDEFLELGLDGLAEGAYLLRIISGAQVFTDWLIVTR